MTSLKINGAEHDLEDGFILKDKYTEELDTMTITIPFSHKLDLSPFDFVEITDDKFGSKYFVVDTWVEETISFNPLKYNYTINLVSETIKLQKVVMPNLKITQPIGLEPKKIAQKLEEYYLTYICPQFNELTLDESIYGVLEVCPEEEFNRPTAFEVFNTLLGKINAVVKVTNHVIGFIRLDEYGNEIDESKLYYDNDTQTIKDYANRLDVQVANGVTEKINFSTPAGITLRGGENQAVLNDDNMVLMLEKPIYDIGEEATLGGVSNISIYLPYKDGANSGIAKLDITDHVVEKAVYDTYKVSNSSDYEPQRNYKRNALYYVRGNNYIEGLSYNETNILGFSTWSALYNIIRIELREDISDSALPDFTEAQIRKNVYFKVEYKTNESFRYVVEKENDYNATLIDNQAEPNVDVLNFGKVEQDKLNRLGNKTQIITATYSKEDKIPELSDYIGNYILAEREIVYYKDFALFKGYLYKDYVRKNMFYGLNSKKRSAQISTESVIRNDIFNIDVEFSLTQHSYDPLIRYILQPLSVSGYPDMEDFEGYDFFEFPKYVIFDAYDKNYEGILVDDNGNSYRILLTPSSFTCGKSNVIQFQMLDNFSAGIRLNGDVTGGTKQEYVKYTDDYGELVDFNAYILTNKRKDLIDNALIPSDLPQYKKFADNLPMLTQETQSLISGNQIMNVGKRLYKDNGETLAISININYKDSENVIVGKFAQYTGIGYRYNIAHYNIGICYSTDYEYEKGDEYGLGDLDESLKLDYRAGVRWIVTDGVENTLDNLTLNFGDKDTSQWKSWGIVEKDTGRLILGINKAKENQIPTTIYLKQTTKDY